MKKTEINTCLTLSLQFLDVKNENTSFFVLKYLKHVFYNLLLRK